MNPRGPVMHSTSGLLERFQGSGRSRLFSKLRCPACLLKQRDSGELLWNGVHLTCRYCGSTWHVVDGIPVLALDVGGSGSTNPERTHESTPREFYEKAFAGEDYSARDLSEHEARVRQIVMEHCSDAPLVLEVGCGRGQLRHLFGDTYLGLDYSLNALRSFDDRAAVCASADLIPVADATFSFVFTIACLEHVPKPDRAFAELERVLTPGGILYLAPAWHVRSWAGEGLPVRPFKHLSLSQKIVKALLPVLDSIVYRGLTQVPWRLYRRARWVVQREPVTLRYKPLRPNYETYWMSDADATCSLDSHEGILYCESRGWECLTHKSVWQRLLAKHDVVVFRKPR